jgi:bifunctional UDP-N-acetylglucosamine pyrophosphorylase/glucosamine-1-phosphate N-acetyltransferase
MAAGLGTRMKSDRAKVLFKVAGRELVVWAVENARAAGADKVVAVLGHQREQVEALLSDRYGDDAPAVAVQAEQRGTGHAVQCALPALEAEDDNRVVVIITGDAPLLDPERIRELTEACEASDSKLALLSTRAPQPMPYGRLLRDGDRRLIRIVEERDASDQEKAIEELNAGFYAVRLGDLRRDIAALSDDNAQRELYLTDLAAAAYQRGGAAVIEAPWHEVNGINTRVELAEVEGHARERINRALMLAGVSMQDPASTFVDADAGPFGTDVWLGSGVHVRGRSKVADRARLDTGVVVKDTEIGADAWVKPHSMLTDAVIGERVQIGPFAHCRPGTRVDEDAKVGNFVETKKAHLMAGAKANHLAYLGDASVGARANVGAGTITCNYDGFAKYRTVIEADAFIGSDSQLVAPVTIGKGAYVGSGTTVTKDVPRASLALSRVKQVNKEGWADRFREVQRKRRRK